METSPDNPLELSLNRQSKPQQLRAHADPSSRGRGRGPSCERRFSRGRPSHGGYTRHHNRNQPVISFHKDQGDVSGSKIDQPLLSDKFYRDEQDDYFAKIEDDSECVQDDKQIVGPDSDAAVGDDEDDPLDAYMDSLASGGATAPDHSGPSTIKPDIAADSSHKPTGPSTSSLIDFDKRGVRLDIDGTDDEEESYFKSADNKLYHSRDLEDKQDLIEYDMDGNVLSVRKVKKEIEPLPVIDHNTISYSKFEKIFYQEHSEIRRLTKEQGEDLRSKLEIKVSGENVPKPVCSFAHFKFDEKLMRVIRKSQYTQPTPIQAQAIPAILSGRNIIGIAVTGSGKTAAYIWPMIIHIMNQPNLKAGDGPIGLVLVPTRELALQVYSEAKKFSSSYNLAVVCAYGGGSKYEQSNDLEAGAEIVVATPGRLIDLIKVGATNLHRVTYLVLDEADRFFELGFEAQVCSICGSVRPDRQTLLFSATFKSKLEQLARTVTNDPIKIVQKTLGEANEDVKQHIVLLDDPSKKLEWLKERLVEFTSAGSILIFVSRIINAEDLHRSVGVFSRETLLLHGDMEQAERNRVITAFKRKENDILIATDVAARGLDIAHIRTVINYDVARDIDTHIHRIGRTGRAGLKGEAYTLFTTNEKDFAAQLFKNLESTKQEIPETLRELAMKSNILRKSRGSRHYRHGDGPRSFTNHDRDGRYRHHRNGHHSSSWHYHRTNEDDRPPRTGTGSHDRQYSGNVSTEVHSDERKTLPHDPKRARRH